MISYKCLAGAVTGCFIFPPIVLGAARDEPKHMVQVPKKDWDACQAGKKSELCDLIRQTKQSNPAPDLPATSEVKQAPAQLPPLFNIANGRECISSTKGLFVRADPLDNFHYLVDPQSDDQTANVASAKGLDISYTNNRVAGTQTATINGRVSYMLFGELCDPLDGDARHPFFRGVGLAPFVSGNGTWSEPLTKTSNSSLKTGADFQVAYSTTQFLFQEHYLYFSPYHQTDFKELAQINGATFAWEPVRTALFMDTGKPLSAALAPYFLFFWQFRAEVDVVNVTVPGLTNLTKGDHIWVGETIRANLALFPQNYISWPDWMGGRFSLIGTAQNFHDTTTSTNASYYTAALQYKLGACKAPKPGDTTNSDACTIQGSSSVSFEYDWGTNKDTLVKVNQYLIKLGYSF